MINTSWVISEISRAVEVAGDQPNSTREAKEKTRVTFKIKSDKIYVPSSF